MAAVIPREAPPIEARDLYRFFRAGEEETLALRGVSLAVSAGEILAVTGPSGSGKSTLLACLAGLDEPAGGSVYVTGLRLSHRPESERAALRAHHIGVLFQTNNLLGHLSITENIELAQRIIKSDVPSPQEILERVGLANRAAAKPSQLSGGEAARAGLAVALANNPAVLLADEPTGELDGGTERRLLDLLRSHADRGCAVLVVTHSPDVVARADRVIALNDGQVGS
ncbi:putative ABC transport system ATP-binding protein [Cryobacterium sp. CAN_C3]|uniref:ABC transporter ATP-binding protein n=1 Tax=unclassified Cryobacterium TaxID=2649013 RepID=UPI0018CB4BD7|nr:ABC transporter ATP-binding protein [Cryobacterium sp. CAN_C3]MEC5155426.1 putative ABC transport system ATP-binding protein [Cryobacterium sp. CAN_C3]